MTFTIVCLLLFPSFVDLKVALVGKFPSAYDKDVFHLFTYWLGLSHKESWVDLKQLLSLIFSRNMRCSWLFIIRDFPGGSVVKNPPSNAGDLDSIPGSGRSPGVGNGNPFTSRSIACNASWIEGPVWLQFMGCKGLVTTEWVSMHTFTIRTCWECWRNVYLQFRSFQDCTLQEFLFTILHSSLHTSLQKPVNLTFNCTHQSMTPCKRMWPVIFCICPSF